jgi:hypothetical protein
LLAEAGVFALTDEFELEGSRQIVHVLWSVEPPQLLTKDTLHFGPVLCEITPAPASIDVAKFDPSELHLRQFAGQLLYRCGLHFSCDDGGRLRLITRFRGALASAESQSVAGREWTT